MKTLNGWFLIVVGLGLFGTVVAAPFGILCVIAGLASLYDDK